MREIVREIGKILNELTVEVFRTISSFTAII